MKSRKKKHKKINGKKNSKEKAFVSGYDLSDYVDEYAVATTVNFFITKT